MTAREEVLFTTIHCFLRPDADLDNRRWARAHPPAPARRPPARARPPCRARPPALRCSARTLGVSPRAIVVKSEIERAIVLKSEIERPIVLGHAPIVRGPIVFISETNRPIVLGSFVMRQQNTHYSRYIGYAILKLNFGFDTKTQLTNLTE